ncbi:hypothetical protein DFH29DRAFT_961510, partial [Suillus ampliporus]
MLTVFLPVIVLIRLHSSEADFEILQWMLFSLFILSHLSVVEFHGRWHRHFPPCFPFTSGSIYFPGGNPTVLSTDL